MNIRRVGAATAVLALSLGLAACGSNGDSGSGGGKPYIAIVSKGFQQQYWQAVKKGADAEAKKEGARITFEGPATETDVEDQIDMLNNAITKKPDALGFAALDSKAAAPLLDQAKSANIPVVAFERFRQIGFRLHDVLEDRADDLQTFLIDRIYMCLDVVDEDHLFARPDEGGTERSADCAGAPDQNRPAHAQVPSSNARVSSTAISQIACISSSGRS